MSRGCKIRRSWILFTLLFAILPFGPSLQADLTPISITIEAIDPFEIVPSQTQGFWAKLRTWFGTQVEMTKARQTFRLTQINLFRERCRKTITRHQSLKKAHIYGNTRTFQPEEALRCEISIQILDEIRTLLEKNTLEQLDRELIHHELPHLTALLKSMEYLSYEDLIHTYQAVQKMLGH
jgi:hypothetical protein